MERLKTDPIATHILVHGNGSTNRRQLARSLGLTPEQVRWGLKRLDKLGLLKKEIVNMYANNPTNNPTSRLEKLIELMAYELENYQTTHETTQGENRADGLKASKTLLGSRVSSLLTEAEELCSSGDGSIYISFKVFKVFKDFLQELCQENEETEKKLPKPKKVFVAPTLDEVKEYFNTIKETHIDPVAFWSFYEANGWVQGRQGKPIKNWKACVTTWQRNFFSPEQRGGNSVGLPQFKLVK